MNDAEIFKERRNLPHDPLGHAVDAQDERNHRGDGADADRAHEPEPDRKGADAENGDAVVEINEVVELGDEPHLRVHRVQELVHALAGVGFLPPRMGEELHRGDVGVAVDDAAGHLRTRVRLTLGGRLQTRHEMPDKKDVHRKPDQERRDQAQVRRRHQNQHSDEINEHVDQNVEQLHHRLAHGEGGLHHLGRHPPGVFVGEERHALAQHLPVHAPARAHGQVAQQGLVGDQRHAEDGERQDNDDEDADQRKAPALLRQERLRIAGGEPVHELAHEGVEQRLPDRDQSREGRHGRDPRPRVAAVMPAERDKPFRRRAVTARRKRRQSLFKP